MVLVYAVLGSCLLMSGGAKFVVVKSKQLSRVVLKLLDGDTLRVPSAMGRSSPDRDSLCTYNPSFLPGHAVT